MILPGALGARTRRIPRIGRRVSAASTLVLLFCVQECGSLLPHAVRQILIKRSSSRTSGSSVIAGGTTAIAAVPLCGKCSSSCRMLLRLVIQVL